MKKQSVYTIAYSSLFAFFLYQFLMVKDIIPPFLKGGGLLILLSLPILLLKNSLRSKLTIRLTTLNSLFFLFIIFQCVSIIILYFYKDKSYIPELLKRDVISILYSITMYLIAFHMPLKNCRNISILYLIIILAIVLTNIGDNGIMDFWNSYRNKTYVSTYQSMAIPILIISLMLFYHVSNRKLFVIVYSMMFITLFFNGARTELYLFVGASTIIFIRYFFSIKNILIILGGILVITIWKTSMTSSTTNKISKNRSLQFLDIKVNTSLQSRNMLTEGALETIQKHPFLGDFGSYFNKSGQGSYAHNILSVWVDYGLLGMILYSSILGYIAIYFMRSFLNGGIKNDSENIIKVMLCLISVGGVLYAKRFDWEILGFAVGFLSRPKPKSLEERV